MAAPTAGDLRPSANHTGACEIACTLVHVALGSPLPEGRVLQGSMDEVPLSRDKVRLETDAVVIGSGFGGGMIAHALVAAGQSVLMLERGAWVARGPSAWEPEGSLDLTPHCSLETPYEVLAGGRKRWMGGYTCVGGPSVFYGAVSMRYRVEDFRPPADIVGDSGAEWPVDYAELEPFYTRAEQLLDVAGDDSGDPTAPPRSAPYPQAAAELSPLSQRIASAAQSLGLSPFALPLAINYRNGANGQQTCVKCRTCDTFACAINAKNDIATKILPPLQSRGMTLRANTVVTRLERDGARIVAVHARDKQSGQELEVRAERVFLAAGALGTPHLLLASGLAQINPAGDLIGAT
jgi:choline dehydrogenase-like flavoprotein